VEALKSMTYTNKVTEMGEMVMVDVVELCTMMLRKVTWEKESKKEREDFRSR
jgi:hypothetical protein